MAFGPRKLIAYVFVGCLAALVLASSIGLIPGIFRPVSATGTLSVLVTDAPVPDLLNLNLTISSFMVQNGTGGWVSIPIKGGIQYFDLLKLQNVTRDLALGSLPVGNYSKIRLQIDTANATLSDGSKIDLRVPSGHIDLQVRFGIIGVKTTSLVIDIVVDKIQIAESGSSGKPANLNPQFKFVVVPPTQ